MNSQSDVHKDIPSHKLITFDIDTIVAREIAGKNYTQMYHIVASFMEDNGFRHIQGSVYVSNKPLRYANIDAICKAFARIYPYISKSIRDIKITNIDKNFFSLNEFFTYTGHSDEYADYYKTHDINDKNNAPQH